MVGQGNIHWTVELVHGGNWKHTYNISLTTKRPTIGGGGGECSLLFALLYGNQAGSQAQMKPGSTQIQVDM